MKSYAQAQPETTRREWWEDDEPYVATEADIAEMESEQLLTAVAEADRLTQAKIAEFLDRIFNEVEAA